MPRNPSITCSCWKMVEYRYIWRHFSGLNPSFDFIFLFERPNWRVNFPRGCQKLSQTTVDFASMLSLLKSTGMMKWPVSIVLATSVARKVFPQSLTWLGEVGKRWKRRRKIMECLTSDWRLPIISLLRYKEKNFSYLSLLLWWVMTFHGSALCSAERWRAAPPLI